MADGTVSQDVVRSRLAELLAQADLNTVSERMLVASLCSDFGEAVKTEYRQLIKVLVKRVVLLLCYTVLLSRLNYVRSQLTYSGCVSYAKPDTCASRVNRTTSLRSSTRWGMAAHGSRTQTPCCLQQSHRQAQSAAWSPVRKRLSLPSAPAPTPTLKEKRSLTLGACGGYDPRFALSHLPPVWPASAADWAERR